MWMFIWTYCVMLFVGNNPVHLFTLQNVTALRNHLFVEQDYDKISRPMMNQSAPTEVGMTCIIYAIYGIDEISQTLKISASVQMAWVDEALMWKPDEFGGIQTVVYPQNNVWKPDVSLKNSVEGFNPLGDSSLNMIVSSDGTVQWEPYQLFASRCVFDITYFPFDQQVCELVFITWSYTSADIVLKGPENKAAVNLDEMTSHPEWDLIHVTNESMPHPRPMMIFRLTLERKPGYVVCNVVLPLVVLIVLNGCVFLVPVSSGEKTSYATTLFLTFIVFSTIIHETLPPSSDDVCYLSVYISIQLFESAAITLMAIIFIRIEKKTESVPIWLKNLLCQKPTHTANTCTYGDNNQIEAIKTNKLGLKTNSIQPYEAECWKDNSGLGHCQNGTEEEESLNCETQKHNDWVTVVQRSERILFISFFLFNSILTTVLFAMLTSSKSTAGEQ